MAQEKKFIGTIFQALDILKKAKDKNIKIEIKRFSENRSLNQNNYLHLLFDMIASEIGEDKDYIKDFLKEKFLSEEKTGIYGTIKFVKQTSKLNKTEFASLTDKILKWSITELNISLPTPDDYLRGEHYEKILLN